MDFAGSNKKIKESMHKFTKTKLMPLNIQKFKKTQQLRLKVQICNQPRDPRISTFDSLELKQFVCCEGIKLGTRKNKSVEKWSYKKIDRRNENNKVERLKQGFKLCKASTTDSLSLDIKSRLIRSSKVAQERKVKLNPEQLAHLRNIPIIARVDILMSKRTKNQMLGFLRKEHKTVVLYQEIKDFTLVESHPNILQPYSLVNLDLATYFVVDECNCQNLKSLVTQFGRVHPKMAIQYIKQVVSALAHLKSYGQSHNRLNMETILHDGQGGIFVNLVKSLKKTLTEQDRLKYFYYFCPEVLLQGSSGFGQKADVWAIGCLALQLLSVTSTKNNSLHPYNRKSNVYQNPNSIQTIKNIHNLMPAEQKVDKTQSHSPRRASLKQEAQSITASALQFIGKCLAINALQRSSLNQLLCHSFIK